MELTRFYVDPSIRRSGIGAALLAAGLARIAGAPALVVNVFADNQVGRAFYKKAGFRLT